jgi:acyl carrier protein
MERKAILSDYIKNEIMRNRNAQLDENEDLLGAGILDSLGILKLVAYIEDTFGIEVPDSEVVYENFHSLNAMVNYLRQH